MWREIDLDRLVPHPEHCNYTDPRTLRTMRGHIDQTGRYEPLTVRPCPGEQARFQVINGHSRLRALRLIGHRCANCIVWDIDDDQAKLYLATLNRLCGKDLPERRALLVESLLRSRELDELAELLPDRRAYLAEIKRLACSPLDGVAEPNSPAELTGEVPAIVVFMLGEAALKEVSLALDLMIHSADPPCSRGQGLTQLALFYLGHCPRPPWEPKGGDS